MKTSLKPRWWNSNVAPAMPPLSSTDVPRPAFNPKVRCGNNPTWLERFDRFILPDSFTGELHHQILDRRFTLQSFAASVRHLKGSTAECGVFKGIGSALICATLDGTYQHSRHY